MIFLLVNLLICLVDAQRGFAFQASQSLSNYIWNAPAGAGVSLAGRDYALSHPQVKPIEVLHFNGCNHGNCESNVKYTIPVHQQYKVPDPPKMPFKPLRFCKTGDLSCL